MYQLNRQLMANPTTAADGNQSVAAVPGQIYRHESERDPKINKNRYFRDQVLLRRNRHVHKSLHD